MTGAEFKSLQIGMYVTDVWNDVMECPSCMKADFCQIKDFNRMGQIKMQPYGKPDDKAFWIYYKDYDLKDKMYASEFKDFTV